MIAKVGTTKERLDRSHTNMWLMQEASGTTVSAIKGTAGTAVSGLAIGAEYNGKLARVFPADNSSTKYKISIAANCLPVGNKTVRFKMKKTGTFVGSGGAFVISTDNNTDGVALYFYTDQKLTWQFRFSGGLDYVTSAYAFVTGESYDVQCTWVASTKIMRIYIKILTGTDAGKWYNSSNIASATMAENASAIGTYTESATTATVTYIGAREDVSTTMLNHCDIWHVQISDTERTDMKNYYLGSN